MESIDPHRVHFRLGFGSHLVHFWFTSSSDTVRFLVKLPRAKRSRRRKKGEDRIGAAAPLYDTLRERAMLRRQIKVLTAEGRLSAWVLGLLPFGIALYMYAVNPDYIGLLFKTTYGIIMLIVAGALLVAGVLWMKKIVDIDV